ncbi:uncharacterized protein BJ171DRAFT_138064 [Polychytrium aggregatum]|uniref:uncharacterized protein n=1 Tax=Polychytrium aggregatum TaxID=110093 RepID=UPI0022FED7A9|nr:uncharacterized protein BJ171DRAFT_138064 [Polychytrium aggregatum]KAI9203646.1 hypothetical protein BJ171DRAFT_138064 [Polychytrium aggregatum]
MILDSNGNITHLNILVFGPAFVGKTTLIHTFLQMQRPKSRINSGASAESCYLGSYDPTIENFYQLQYVVVPQSAAREANAAQQVVGDNGIDPILPPDIQINDSHELHKRITLNIIDAGGHPCYSKLWPSLITSADAFMLVYDVGDKASFDSMWTFYRIIVETKWIQPEYIPAIMVGNMVDTVASDGVTTQSTRRPRMVPLTTGRQMADILKIKFSETTALAPVAVARCFSELISAAQAKTDARLQIGNLSLTPAPVRVRRVRSATELRSQSADLNQSDGSADDSASEESPVGIDRTMENRNNHPSPTSCHGPSDRAESVRFPTLSSTTSSKRDSNVSSNSSNCANSRTSGSTGSSTSNGRKLYNSLMAPASAGSIRAQRDQLFSAWRTCKRESRTASGNQQLRIFFATHKEMQNRTSYFSTSTGYSSRSSNSSGTMYRQDSHQGYRVSTAQSASGQSQRTDTLRDDQPWPTTARTPSAASSVVSPVGGMVTARKFSAPDVSQDYDRLDQPPRPGSTAVFRPHDSAIHMGDVEHHQINTKPPVNHNGNSIRFMKAPQTSHTSLRIQVPTYNPDAPPSSSSPSMSGHFQTATPPPSYFEHKRVESPLASRFRSARRPSADAILLQTTELEAAQQMVRSTPTPPPLTPNRSQEHLYHPLLRNGRASHGRGSGGRLASLLTTIQNYVDETQGQLSPVAIDRMEHSMFEFPIQSDPAGGRSDYSHPTSRVPSRSSPLVREVTGDQPDQPSEPSPTIGPFAAIIDTPEWGPSTLGETDEEVSRTYSILLNSAEETSEYFDDDDDDPFDQSMIVQDQLNKGLGGSNY